MASDIVISMTPHYRSAHSFKRCTTSNDSTRHWTISHRWSLNRLYKPELRNGRRNRPWYRSTRVPIVAYKRSWSEIFSCVRTKKEKEPKRKKNSERGRPVETATAEEIKIGCLRH